MIYFRLLKKAAVLSLAVFWGLAGLIPANDDLLVWPPAPDKARIEYIGNIDCTKLTPKTGLFGKLLRTLSGSSDKDKISLPFDIVNTDKSLFAVCQNIPALIQIDITKNNFKFHECKDVPLVYPVSLCDGGDKIFISDSEAGIIYVFENNKVKPFISTNLLRPTGIAAIPEKQKLYVIDTGDHTLKVFDYSGNLLETFSGGSDSTPDFHFPTFVSATVRDGIYINDALNYMIRNFNINGQQQFAFGKEGDSPGYFARPKGIATDSDGHIYVVDNIFDNVQVFNRQGELLLVIGSSGQMRGQFWSPAGIDIANDTIYVADTYNNRIQILHYLGSDND